MGATYKVVLAGAA